MRKKKKMLRSAIRYQCRQANLNPEKERAYKEKIQSRLNEDFVDFKHASGAGLEKNKIVYKSRTARFLTKNEIEKIRELSTDHYIKDIARIIGVTKVTIRKVQDDPRNKIVNPLRKYTVTGKYKKQQGKVVEGYFNWEEYKKYYAY